MSDSNQIAEALMAIAQQLKNLGNGSATSDRGHGAVEGLAMKTDDAAKTISSALDGIAHAIDGLAEEIGNLSQAVGTISLTK